MNKAPTTDKALAPAAAVDNAVNGGQKIAAAQASMIYRLDLGGGALGAVAATSSPISFLGTGEHFDGKNREI